MPDGSDSDTAVIMRVIPARRENIIGRLLCLRERFHSVLFFGSLPAATAVSCYCLESTTPLDGKQEVLPFWQAFKGEFEAGGGGLFFYRVLFLGGFSKPFLCRC